MGHAAYQRGSVLISRLIDEDRRDSIFEMLAHLNVLPKLEGAKVPFGPIRFVFGNGVWWAECPTTGFGYHYPTLREAVRSWKVTITGYDATDNTWKGEPWSDTSNG